jgi:hypothetical protein
MMLIICFLHRSRKKNSKLKMKFLNWRASVDQRTNRIIKKTLINLCKLFAFVGGIFTFMLACIWLSVQTTGDVMMGIATFFVPLIIYAVWDQSKAQVEHELWKEEGTIATLSRKYE